MTNTRYIGPVASEGKETVDRISPRVGYKVAGIYMDGDKPRLVSPHFFENQFHLSDNSLCSKKDHKDFVSCTCGFYAYNNIDDVYHHWRVECGGYSNFAILEVALSGSVIVAEKGYRASHQRVRKVVMPRCWNCDKAGTTFVKHQNKFLVAACSECSEGLVTYTFDYFSKAYSPEGFNPIQIFSAKLLREDAQKFLAPERLQQEALDAIEKLAAAGRIDLIDAIISKGHAALNTMLGMGETTND